MPVRERSYSQRAVFILAAVLVAAVPLAVWPGLHDSYTLPKAALVRLLAALALLGWVIGQAVAVRLSWRRSPLDWAVGAFMLAVLAATAFSVDHRLSVYGHYKRYEDVFTLLIYGLLYFVATNNLKAADTRRLITIWLVTAGLVSAYAVSQYAGFDFVTTSVIDGRAISTLGNPVFLGSWLVLTLPLGVGRWLEAQGPSGARPTRVGYLMLSLLILAAIVVSFSRGAWLALPVAAIVLALARRRAGLAVRGREGLAWVALGVIVFSVFAAVNFIRPAGAGHGVVERIVAGADLSRGTTKTRLLLWRTALAEIPERPLLGFGPDALGPVYDVSLSAEYREFEPTARIDKAHNEFLNVATTTGLVGLFAYLTVILLFVQVAWSSLAERDIDQRDRRLKAEGAALTAGILGYLTAVQFSFSQVEVSVFFWLALALAVLALGLVRSSRARPVGRLWWSIPLLLAPVLAVWLAVFAWNPVVADYHFKNGVVAEDQGDYQRAVAEFRVAARMSGVRGFYYSRLARRLQLDAIEAARAGGGMSDKELIEEILQAYADAEGLEQTDALLYTGMGSFYTFLSRTDPRFAEPAALSLERSLDLNAFIPETHVNLGVLRTQAGDIAAAAESFERALELAPDNGVARENLRRLRGRD